MGNTETHTDCLYKNEVSAVIALIGRILPDFKNDFFLEKVPFSLLSPNQAYFELRSSDDKVAIRANDNVSLAYGFHYYLRNYLNFSVSWNGCGQVPSKTLIKKLPVIEKPLQKLCNFPYRYYLNYCTHSYSMAFWGWPRWEHEIDLMALHGINLVLASQGQQIIWRNVLKELGFVQKDIENFIPGPTFEAWWLMQNLEGWGGPVSDEFIEGKRDLQRKIVKRLKELDMQPILQCFFGMVPRVSKKYFPNGKFVDCGMWNGFERPLFLDPEDQLFDTFAKKFYEEQFLQYGECYFFAGEPFHEISMGKSAEGMAKYRDFSCCARKIYQTLRSFYEKHNKKARNEESSENLYKSREKQRKSPEITWVLQAWEEGAQPSEAVLKVLKPGETLILDLFSDALPQWGIEGIWSRGKNSYCGHNWLWCVLDNFGGNNGIFGRIQKIANDLPQAAEHPLGRGKLKGVGITMEGIERNCIIFDFLLDFVWDFQGISLKDWVKTFVTSRYGEFNEELVKAWLLLIEDGPLSEKNDFKMGSISVFNENPKMMRFFLKKEEENSMKNARKAWKLFAFVAKKLQLSDSFAYDFVDLTREVMNNYSVYIYISIMESAKMKNFQEFQKNFEEFLEILKDLDELLANREEFLLGKWIKSAQNAAKNEKEKKLFVFYAKMQISLWGPSKSLINYAKKEWNGLIQGFYRKKWEIFYEEAKKNWETLKFPDFAMDFYEFDKKWAESNEEDELYIDCALGKGIEKCLEIYRKIYKKYKKIGRCKL